MDMVFFLLKFIPPLQLGLMYYCFSGIRTLLIVAAGVWFLAASYSFLKDTERKKELEDAGTGGLSFKEASESCDLSVDDVADTSPDFKEFLFSQQTDSSLGEKINALFSASDSEEDLFQECEEGERAMENGQGATKSDMENRTERLKSNIKQKYFTYTPLNTWDLAGDLKRKVRSLFEMDETIQATSELMPFQKASTGGPGNTATPQRSNRKSRKSSVFKKITALESNLKTHRRSRALSSRKTIMSIFNKAEIKRNKSVAKMETPNPLFTYPQINHQL